MSTATMERRPPAKAVEQDKVSLDAIEQVVLDCGLAQLESQGKFAKAFALAKGIRQLREMITAQMMEDVLPLMNTALGFRTDKDPNRPTWNAQAGRKEAPQPYPMETVKECLIEAVLRGANPVGNEFNIISGQAYMTRQFYQRIVGQIEGVTDVKWMPGTVIIKEDGEAKVSCMLSWKKDGVVGSIDRTGRSPETASLQVRLNKGMGLDGAIGKAARKIFKQAYEQITGSEAAPDGDADEVVVGSVVPGSAHNKDEDFDARMAAAKTVVPHPTDPSKTIDTSTSNAPPDPVVLPDETRTNAAPEQEADAGAEAFNWSDFAMAEKRCREQARDMASIDRAAFNGALTKYAVALGHGPTKPKTAAEWEQLYVAISAGTFNFKTGTIIPA